jgi:hypothetical protein
MRHSLRYNVCSVSLRAVTERSAAERETGMLVFPRSHNLDEEWCDHRWTVSGWAVTSRVVGLLRLLDDSFSLPGVQSAYRYA